VKNLKLGVAAKAALITGIIVFITLTANTFVLHKLESNLVSGIFQQYVAKVDKTIDQKGIELKEALKNKVRIITGICASASASFLYNIDTNELKKVLTNYMDFEGIASIEVFDEEKEPFMAIWRDDKITIARELPSDLPIDRELVFTSDSKYENQRIGSIRVFFTEEYINKKMVTEKKEANEAIAGFRKKVDKNFNKSTLIQIGILVFVIVILVVSLMRTLFVFMSKPLYKLKLMAIDLAEGEGDLTKRLEITSKDDISELAEWFNKFIERMQLVIQDFSVKIENLQSASTTMAAISEHLALSAETVSQKSNSVASATEEMSSNMTIVANTSEQTTSNVTMVAAATEEMNVTFNDITNHSEKARGVTLHAVKKAQNASSKVHELGIAASEISKVTEVITEISEQTNLLALNATIEAARAGEAGKGFAVVANEIKELAKQTAEATQNIKTKIEGIQHSTDGTVNEIGEISRVIDDVTAIVDVIVNSVKEQGIATKDISQNVSEASVGIQEVNSNIAQSSSVAGEIAGDIADVNASAEEMAENCSQVNTSAEQLALIADQLKKQVAKFKV
jgi:methyl-accepting chemotaxis protein